MRPRAHRWIALWRAAPLLALGSCVGTGDPLASREWLEASAGAVQVRSRSPGELEDAFGWRLGGGYDINTDPLRLSWEVDAQWATHDFDDGSGVESDISAWVIGTGLRLSADLEFLPLSVWGRGGVAWRDERPADALVDDLDGGGTYWGCGLEWRYSAVGSLGPMATWFRGDDQDVATRFVALNARFRL